MHGQVEAIQRQELLQGLKELVLERVVGRPFHRATRNGAGIKGGRKRMRIGAQKAELRRGRQSFSGENPEFVDTSADPAIGAAFDMNAAKSKAHERSILRRWELTSNLYMTPLPGLNIIYLLNYLAAGHGKSSPRCILEPAGAMTEFRASEWD